MNSYMIRSVSKTLTNPKMVKITIIINLITFIPGLIFCVLIATFLGPQGYNIWANYISELGSIAYTPVPFLFDLILIFGAIFTVPAYLYNNKFLIEGTKEIIFNSTVKRWKRFYYFFIDLSAFLGYFFLLVGSVGLFGIGIFSIDSIPSFHYFFSFFVFAGLIFGALFSGIAILLNKVICPHFLGLYMIFGPFMAGILFLNPPASITLQFLEWVMLFAQQIWLLPAAFYTLRHIKKNLRYN
jgi:hypothetical protein